MSDEKYYEVKTASGVIRGERRADASTAFLGIPFAQAPVGALRFAAPVRMQPWSGVRDALSHGATPARASGDGLIPEPAIAGEQTLNLDVFAPAPDTIDSPLPVLVWIHGGGYFSGSPASPWYDGGSYNRDGVVTVNLSYRLGFDGFGWIEGAPANRGVLDWIAGLEWVQENIHAFGGDPRRVTIAGQSAGGGAVLTLLGMERAQSLFSAVHAISGALGDLPERQAVEFAHELGARLGVPPTADALRGISEERIFAVQQELATPPGMAYLRSMVDSGPLVAPVVDGELIRRPTFDSLAMGIGADKPLLLGATDEEFVVLTAPGAEQFAATPLDDLFTSMGVPTEVRDEYLAGEAGYVERGNAFALGRYLTDAIFRATVVRTARARGSAPTWVYRFAFVSGAYGLSGHGLDVPFWFDCLDAEGVETRTGPHPPRSLANEMHTASVDFITSHDPGWPAWSAAAGTSRTFGGTEDPPMSRNDYDDVIPLLALPYRL